MRWITSKEKLFRSTDCKWTPNGNGHTSYPEVRKEESHWGLDSREGVRGKLRKPARIEKHIWVNGSARHCCHFNVQLVVVTEVTQKESWLLPFKKKRSNAVEKKLHIWFLAVFRLLIPNFSNHSFGYTFIDWKDKVKCVHQSVLTNTSSSWWKFLHDKVIPWHFILPVVLCF